MKLNTNVLIRILAVFVVSILLGLISMGPVLGTVVKVATLVAYLWAAGGVTFTKR